MGDRYTITATREEIIAWFGKEISDRYEPRYNAAPTQVLPLITMGSDGFSFFYWGQLPEWSHNRSIGSRLLYAPAEKLTTKTGLHALEAFRCVIPMDGFYAWKQVSKKGKIPHRIVLRNGGLFAVAGLWEEFEDDDGQPAHTFRIITIPSSSDVSGVADRMPVMINRESLDDWLSPETDMSKIREILQDTAGDGLRAYTVSPRIDDITNDSPSLIDAFSPVDQHGNYSLFD